MIPIQSISEIRRDNLRFLVETRFNGNQSALARALDVEPNLISRLLNPASKKKIGDDFARRVERAADKPVNWLDVWHGLTSLREPVATYAAGDTDEGPHPAEMLALWAELPPAFRSYLLQKARLLAEYVGRLPPFLRNRIAGPTPENLDVWEADLQDEMERTFSGRAKTR
jgi:hypothetical protein